MPILGTAASQNTKSFLQPNAPTIGTATDVGTSRAYNNGSATVTFTAAATGAAATSFTATSSPGGYTVTGASSPLTVTGLQSATAYTFVVKATNAVGDSSNSSASNSITATTVPQAPTIGTVTRTSNTVVSVPFTAGATGGSAFTSYTATSSPSIALTVSGTSTPLTVTGTFASGTAYTIQIVAVNANGSSTASSASNSLTPNPYAIGGTGPGGGIIVYNAGSVLSWGRYIEIATSASSPSWTDATTQWGSGTDQRTAIGTGLSLSASNATVAAPTCTAYRGGGNSNWFLGSLDEVNQMYINRAVIGTYASDWYWTSSAHTTSLYAWVQNFAGGAQDNSTKDQDRYSRPMRYFT